MKKWIKHNCKALIVLLLFAVVGPLIINILFKCKAPCGWLVAEWEPSAALTYYGTIIAATIAAFGVFLTIRYSQQNYAEDVRNRTLPFIVIDMLKTKSRMQLFPNTSSDSKTDEKTERYEEYKLQDYYCILENGNIVYKTGLTKEQKKLLENGGTKWVAKSNGGSLVAVDDVCIPIEIENVGNGTAIRLRYGLNRKDIRDEEKKYLPVISLKTFNPIMLHIFSEDCSRDSANLGEYILSFYYEDIYSNKYKQEFAISIDYDEEKHVPIVSVDMGHIQEFLGGNQNG